MVSEKTMMKKKQHSHLELGMLPKNMELYFIVETILVVGLIVISYCDVQTIEWTSQRLSNYLSS